MKKETEKSSLLSKWKNREQKNVVSNTIEKAPDGINIPLSHGQKRLWFLQQLYPKNAFYNYSETYTFSGKLIDSILIESLKRVYRDHDILRTTYHIENEEIFQSIDNYNEVTISTHDLSALSKEASKIECQKIIEADASKYFDLTKCPLVRATLIKINTTTNILQTTLHHIVTDKWSMGILREDLARYYRELSLNNNISSKRTEIQYTDYALWQSKNEINTESLNYWKSKLSGEIPILNLPTDYTRPLHPTFKGAASFTQTFNKQLSGNLLSLSKQLETTPYVLMLSVYYVFLYKYSGQIDILVGSPVTNRDQKVLENLIGFFNETVILRTNISPNISFNDLAKEVHKNTLDAFENKNIPFDILVKELKVERSLAVNPFFQVMFLYHSVLENSFFDTNVNLTHTWFDSKVSKFDLTLYIAEENGILSSTFEYATDLFDETTINRFQEYYKVLLESVVSNPSETILDLQILSNTEKQFFLNQEKEISNHFSEYKGIHNIIENISKLKPNSIAVTYKKTSITYQVLNDKANFLASYMLNNIKTNNEIIGLCIDRSIDMIVGMLAILKTGCAYLPIDPEYPEQRINFILNDANANTVITQHSSSHLFKEHNIQQIHVDKLYEPVDFIKLKFPNVKETDLAYIIYTSGSTGQPKGVPITHKNIINSTAGRLDFYDENPTAFLLMSSISFDSSKAGIFWTLCTGGKLVIAKKRIEQDIATIGNIINDQAISHTLLLPSLYKLVLEYVDDKKLQSLKSLMVAGEACFPELCLIHFNKLSNVKLYNEYGPTEATVWCIAHQIKKGHVNNIVPIGKPVAGAIIYLLDDLLNFVPFGSVGEIYIGGKGLTNGYWNRPELSNKVLVTNPLNPSEKLYKTGDLGKYSNDENIEFLGRADQQIKIRGFRVELNEIEKVIKTYNSTINKAIVLIEDDTIDLDFKNLDETIPLNELVNILKKMNEDEVNGIFSFIQSLTNDEKEYLLNQIEA